MTKTIILLIILFSLNSAFSQFHPQGTVWKITSLDWQPYSGEKLAGQGHAIQKLRKILEKRGIRLVVEFYPWRRAQKRALSKEYIGYFPAWPEEVSPGFTKSLPVDWSKISFLKKQEKQVRFQSLEELLQKYRVGIVKTYNYPVTITKLLRKYSHNVIFAPNEKSLLLMLSKDRFAVGITDPRVMKFLADQQGIKSIESIKIIMKKELVVAVRNGLDNAEHLKILNQLLKDENNKVL